VFVLDLNIFFITGSQGIVLFQKILHPYTRRICSTRVGLFVEAKLGALGSLRNFSELLRFSTEAGIQADYVFLWKFDLRKAQLGEK